jgi:anti-sigma B factor antagonist
VRGAVPAGVETSVGLRSEHHPDGVVVLRLGGDIDLTTIDGRRAALLYALRRAPGEIILDTGDVTYLASAGVGLLMEIIQISPDRIRLRVRPGSPTARILALAGLDDIVTK